MFRVSIAVSHKPNQSKVFLDYAHTPDALENAILSLKQHFKNNITVVFGCGGERDKSKRKLMGNVAKIEVQQFAQFMEDLLL